VEFLRTLPYHLFIIHPILVPALSFSKPISPIKLDWSLLNRRGMNYKVKKYSRSSPTKKNAMFYLLWLYLYQIIILPHSRKVSVISQPRPKSANLFPSSFYWFNLVFWIIPFPCIWKKRTWTYEKLIFVKPDSESIRATSSSLFILRSPIMKTISQKIHPLNSDAMSLRKEVGRVCGHWRFRSTGSDQNSSPGLAMRCLILFCNRHPYRFFAMYSFVDQHLLI